MVDFSLKRLTKVLRHQIYGRLENRILGNSFEEVNQIPSRFIDQRTKESVSGMVSRSNENRLEKENKQLIKDPWFN
jgi:hypothetical protein